LAILIGWLFIFVMCYELPACRQAGFRRFFPACLALLALRAGKKATPAERKK
jgi:hypothetical protein